MQYKGYIFRIQIRKQEFKKAFERYKKLAGDTPRRVPIKKTAGAKLASNEIFIVHGHNDGVKEKTARFLEQLGLKPIILHEMPNEGRTIIEKFEDHAKVGFAVILMTHDDFGGKTGESDMRPRARQNVILEQGYFLGALGRNRVCVLYVDGVELPSDLLGVIYIPLDDKDAWKIQLAKEIKAAGIEVDMNTAFS